MLKEKGNFNDGSVIYLCKEKGFITRILPGPRSTYVHMTHVCECVDMFLPKHKPLVLYINIRKGLISWAPKTNSFTKFVRGITKFLYFNLILLLSYRVSPQSRN